MYIFLDIICIYIFSLKYIFVSANKNISSLCFPTHSSFCQSQLVN